MVGTLLVEVMDDLYKTCSVAEPLLLDHRILGQFQPKFQPIDEAVEEPIDDR